LKTWRLSKPRKLRFHRKRYSDPKRLRKHKLLYEKGTFPNLEACLFT
jgi:hypothetical protein